MRRFVASVILAACVFAPFAASAQVVKSECGPTPSPGTSKKSCATCQSQTRSCAKPGGIAWLVVPLVIAGVALPAVVAIKIVRNRRAGAAS